MTEVALSEGTDIFGAVGRVGAFFFQIYEFRFGVERRSTCSRYALPPLLAGFSIYLLVLACTAVLFVSSAKRYFY